MQPEQLPKINFFAVNTVIIKENNYYGLRNQKISIKTQEKCK